MSELRDRIYLAALNDPRNSAGTSAEFDALVEYVEELAEKVGMEQPKPTGTCCERCGTTENL